MQAAVEAFISRWQGQEGGQERAPGDVMAYLAAVMAHPAFTTRFRDISSSPACACR